MAIFQIRKGRDIKIKGAAEKRVVDSALPVQVAIQPLNFPGLKTRLLVKEQDSVLVGTPILEDKSHPEIKIVSPASGKVLAIIRGDKRILLKIVIQTDGRQQGVPFSKIVPEQTETWSREQIIQRLLEAGLWPFIRQRPFSKVANPKDAPKAVFIQAMNTEPLALDVDFVLQNREADFQVGLDILRRLTQGQIHLCCSDKAASKALTQSKNIQTHRFSGPHPAGNVSTHIHSIDPVQKGDIVWYLEAMDVLRIAHLFLRGTFFPEQIVAITGEGARNRVYKKTTIGVPMAHLLDNQIPSGLRFISGSVLAGEDVGSDGFLSFYDSQVSVLPQGGKREFLGWLSPGLSKYSFSKTFVSSFLPEKVSSLDTDKNGSDRAIVFNHIYDQYVSLDIMTFFLIRAVLAGDIEEAEKLGILECDEEDFALCSFACPSKTDIGGIIRQGLDLIEKEG